MSKGTQTGALYQSRGVGWGGRWEGGSKGRDICVLMGYPCSSASKDYSCRRPGFDPWVREIPWRRERLPTAVFWPEEFHGLYSPWGHKQSDTTKQLSHKHMYAAAAAAAVKSVHSCPTLCDPIDDSPRGSAVPGILQVRTLEQVAISFSSAWKWKG